MSLWVCPKCNNLYAADTHVCPTCRVPLQFATLGPLPDTVAGQPTIEAATDKQRRALLRIIEMAHSLSREPVQSRSVERRYAILIESAARAGLE